MIAAAPHARGAILPVLAHPAAKRDGIVGERAGALRVAVTAAPEKGKANVAIQSVLAQALGCKSNTITLLSGETSRQKRFLIDGITSDELLRRLAPFIDEQESPPSLSPRLIEPGVLSNEPFAQCPRPDIPSEITIEPWNAAPGQSLAAFRGRRA